MSACENKTFESEEVVISKLPIDSSFLNQHYYEKVNVKNSTDFHIGPKIEVHINNDRKNKRSKILKDILPELRRNEKEIKIWPVVAVVAVLVLISLIIVTAVLILNTKTEPQSPQSQNIITVNDVNKSDGDRGNKDMTYNGWNILKIVTRLEWIAEPPRDPLNKIAQPVPQIVITHTATETCTNRSKCKLLVREIQDFHTEGRQWSDIGYNFLVGGDGYVYEGRGWDYIGAFARGFNNVSIGIAMIGTFITQKPTEKQITASKLLIDEGVSLKKIANNYRVLAHCNVSDTTSPGLMVYEEIKTWPHFSEIPI